MVSDSTLITSTTASTFKEWDWHLDHVVEKILWCCVSVCSGMGVGGRGVGQIHLFIYDYIEVD